ncbi:hypothetical protein N9N67_10675 [Bacteriovoracaceae bacterium]|nr:hypothetical protein [Bacteriovoracaceae bacterium]
MNSRIKLILFLIFIIVGCNKQESNKKEVGEISKVKVQEKVKAPFKADKISLFKQATRKINRIISREGILATLEISQRKDLLKTFSNKIGEFEGPCGEKTIDLKVTYLSNRKVVFAGEKVSQVERGSDILDTMNLFNEEKKEIAQVFVPYGFQLDGIAHNRKAVLMKIKLNEVQQDIFKGIENKLIQSGYLYLKFQNGPIEVADWADQRDRKLEPKEKGFIKDSNDDSAYKGVLMDPVHNTYVTFNYPCT